MSNAFSRLHLRWRQPHFVRKMVARCHDTTQDVAHLRLIIDEP
jgi:hypothetical protein